MSVGTPESRMACEAEASASAPKSSVVANQSSRLTEVHYLNEHGEDIILWNEPARD